MPILKINVMEGAPRLRDGGDLGRELANALAELPDCAPIMILLHGYQFSPATPDTDPHRHILSLTPNTDCWKALSWPAQLGFNQGDIGEGLCIAVGWEARGSLWTAWRNAASTGKALCVLIDQITALRPGPINIVAHSLGARVVLAAVPDLAAGSIGRAVLMAGAEYRSVAQTALASHAGQTAEFINITSRENDPYDAGIEWLIRAPTRHDRTLGAGLGDIARNWLDVQVDCRRTRAVFEQFGHPIPAPNARMCHWSTYLRPGLLALYRDMIRLPDQFPLHLMRLALPKRRSPRWSRLTPFRRALQAKSHRNAPT